MLPSGRAGGGVGAGAAPRRVRDGMIYTVDVSYAAQGDLRACSVTGVRNCCINPYNGTHHGAIVRTSVPTNQGGTSQVEYAHHCEQGPFNAPRHYLTIKVFRNSPLTPQQAINHVLAEASQKRGMR